MTDRESWGTKPAMTGAVDLIWAAGTVEVRPVSRRQLFVGGQPVGDVFE
jgi:hypothetical protein